MYGTYAIAVKYFIKYKQINPVNKVDAKNPKLNESKNKLFSIKLLFITSVPSDNSNPIAPNNPITIAANGAPGMPNSTVGMNADAFCELLEPSGPITPLMLP